VLYLTHNRSRKFATRSSRLTDSRIAGKILGCFLNGTDKPAILLEICFCDNTNDSNLFNQHFEAICEALAESIGGQQVPDERPPPTEPVEPEPPPAELHVEVAITAPPGVIVNVTQSVSGAAPQDVSVLQKS
jgi:hypothetical protein